jgi:hypothetical protein
MQAKLISSLSSNRSKHRAEDNRVGSLTKYGSARVEFGLKSHTLYVSTLPTPLFRYYIIFGQFTTLMKMKSCYGQAPAAVASDTALVSTIYFIHTNGFLLKIREAQLLDPSFYASFS